MGPSAIRYAGVIERLEELNIEIEDRGEIEIGRPPMETSSEGLRYLRSVVEANKKLATVVNNVIESGSFPLIFGGDHSMAIRTLASVSKHYNNLGVI
jgi:arginase